MVFMRSGKLIIMRSTPSLRSYPNVEQIEGKQLLKRVILGGGCAFGEGVCGCFSFDNVFVYNFIITSLFCYDLVQS